MSFVFEPLFFKCVVGLFNHVQAKMLINVVITLTGNWQVWITCESNSEECQRHQQSAWDDWENSVV